MHRIYFIPLAILIAILSIPGCSNSSEKIKIKPWKSLKLYEPSQKKNKGLMSVDFKNTPLSTALQIVSEHYGVSMLIDENISKNKITFRQIDSSPQSIIAKLCIELNLNKNEVSEDLIMLSSNIDLSN